MTNVSEYLEALFSVFMPGKANATQHGTNTPKKYSPTVHL